MRALGVTASETWMIGDNLEWEVEAPQRLGIYAIWIDVHGDGLPAGSTVKPDRIIRSLTDLLPQRTTARAEVPRTRLPGSVPQRFTHSRWSRVKRASVWSAIWQRGRIQRKVRSEPGVFRQRQHMTERRAFGNAARK
jgi:hypothetical protein